MAHNHKVIPAIALLACLIAGLALWADHARAQDSYREALIAYGIDAAVVDRFAAAGAPQEGLSTVELGVIDSDGIRHAFQVELANTARQHQIGLMLRPYMAPDAGMLFLMEDGPKSFWMANTLIPLDIIYIDKDRRIVNVGQGEPLNRAPVPSAGDAMYVLELNQGTAQALGFGPGDLVEWTAPQGT